MTLFVPLYKDSETSQKNLLLHFQNKEIKIIEPYFLKAIEIMNETPNKLNW